VLLKVFQDRGGSDLDSAINLNGGEKALGMALHVGDDDLQFPAECDHRPPPAGRARNKPNVNGPPPSTFLHDLFKSTVSLFSMTVSNPIWMKAHSHRGCTAHSEQIFPEYTDLSLD
jgi:hypothetical protein